MNDDILDEDIATNTALKKAEKPLRLLNFIIDLAATYLLSTEISPVSSLLPSLINAIAPTQEISIVVYSFIIPLFTYILYIFLMEVTLQTTLGKILTRTKVFTSEGYKATPGQIFKRTILRLIPFEAFTFLTGYNFHDRFSNTIVCRVSKF